MTTHLHREPGSKAYTTWFGRNRDKGGAQVEVIERMDDTSTKSGVCYHVRTTDQSRPAETAWIDSAWLT